MDLVLLSAILIALGGILAGFLALARLGLWVYAAPAVLALVLALAALPSGPKVEPPPKGALLVDCGGPCTWIKDRYEKDRALYGEPVGSCSIREGTFTCFFTQAWLESNPQSKDEYWRVQLSNLGLGLMRARGIPEDPSPAMSPVVMAYMASEASRGVDVLAIYGYPRTNPRRAGDAWEQYWDKTVLTWPATEAGAGDPSQVRRKPMGSTMWSIENGRVDPERPDPWTPARRLFLGAALGCLLVSAAPWLLPGLRRSWGYEAGI